MFAQSLPAAAISIAYDHERQGAAVTRNRTVYGAQTEWVAFLDDDDEFYPFHLEKLRECAEDTCADVVYPWFDVRGGTDPFPMHEGRQWDPNDPHIIPITTLVRRSVVIQAGGFRPPRADDQERTVANEDWHFWLEVSRLGAEIVHLPERTWRWHHDTGNTAGLPTRW